MSGSPWLSANTWPNCIRTSPCGRPTAPNAPKRALSAEMHAGFSALRQHYPFNARRVLPAAPRPPEVERDITRFSALVESLRVRFAARGPFLMGEFSILDAMYAPVAGRCRTYSIALPSRSQAWVDHILALPAMVEWYAAAAEEPWILPASEPQGAADDTSGATA
ncbi:glutathione S-transferase C-terminal domain-containing protein [Chitinimonas arctica]|uniref:glutathione S-transferase C-terminal domain-containing protein n=1 Tax=Chitinimonas arctica TaxID=2594795 RepID=UPI001CC4DA30|nr:glutathione S-transferase C-terminal domain-containing protein [Chitinimonas arctica]